MPSSKPARTGRLWLRILRYVLIAVVVGVVLFGFQAARLYTDWLWFRELQQPGVFSTIVLSRVMLFFGFGALFFVLLYANLWLAQRLSTGRPRPRIVDFEREEFAQVVRRVAKWGAVALAVVMAFLVGGNAATHWSEYLLYMRGVPFGEVDPVFGRDIGFYVFQLPMLNYLQGLLLFSLGFTAAAVAAYYYADQGIDVLSTGKAVFAPHVRRHLLVLLAGIAFAIAWGQWLSRYELLFADNRIYFGAGYADLNARLPGLTVQAAAMAVVGLLCLLVLRSERPFRVPIVGAVVWLVLVVVTGGIWPAIVQRVMVVPNQFARERPFIERDIAATRRAYGLDRVQVVNVTPEMEVTASELDQNRATLENVRLWDLPQLGAVYRAKEALATYYRFSLPPTSPMTAGEYNIDVDRYQIGGRMRQVMLAARELYTEDLPPQARTWQNERLIYTHGYGVVMSPVNEIDAEGLPTYFLSDIPVTSTVPGIEVEVPQIYYGELAMNYVFVGARPNEFAFPAKEGHQETRYTGRGGVPLGGTLSRLAWSVRLGDFNMLVSDDLKPTSRILFRRNIRERVQTLAPMLNWDNDPYLVINRGRLLWVLDGYTTTHRYPYSRPYAIGTVYGTVDQRFNYIRNSVKAVVDAYHGSATFYVADAEDPLIRTYERLFPSLFTPIDEMPSDLRAHMRYPEDLLRIQRDMYATYHVEDPRVFYGKEDQWAVPDDPTIADDAPGRTRRMMPYYVVMRSPGSDREKFQIITPFTPLARPNLAAWMSAKCDPEDYGTIVVYRFPKGTGINGPQNVMSQVKADPSVSQYQTLLGQLGSRVIFSNLLVIPIGESVLSVIPLYVQAAGAGIEIPQIRQVIVATGNRIAMRPTLETALAALRSGAPVAAKELLAGAVP
ncbi:MAG TPA: UPF0182 family protein, partial [Chthonomonadales bacterium]|nr:UPF0182 family protein [Chthonomonadales bacterium]